MHAFCKRGEDWCEALFESLAGSDSKYVDTLFLAYPIVPSRNASWHSSVIELVFVLE